MCRFWRALVGEEGVKAVQFILGRWVEAVGMCLREGDNVATRSPRSSAETWRASISLQQLELFKLRNVPKLLPFESCCSLSLWVDMAQCKVALMIERCQGVSKKNSSVVI